MHQQQLLGQPGNEAALAPSGVGKTHLAAFICRSLIGLNRFALLLIDDIGYVRKGEAETSVLFELVMHRYERRSLLVTSNQPFSELENVFSNSAMTVAAVARLWITAQSSRSMARATAANVPGIWRPDPASITRQPTPCYGEILICLRNCREPPM